MKTLTLEEIDVFANGEGLTRELLIRFQALLVKKNAWNEIEHEGVPEKEGMYLVAYDSGKVCEGFVACKEQLSDDGIHEPYYSFIAVHTGEKVVAWKEMPEYTKPKEKLKIGSIRYWRRRPGVVCKIVIDGEDREYLDFYIGHLYSDNDLTYSRIQEKDLYLTAIEAFAED